MEKFKWLTRAKISQLPKTSGVYAFKKDTRLLYIGKAKNLRERVKQHDELLGLAEQLGYIKTGSEIEALLLEAKLIKKHQPKYNVAWRDDKNYFYVGITKEEFPRIFITHQASEGSEGKDENKVLIAHQPKSQNTKYKIQNTDFVGPFVDGKTLKQALKELRKRSPFRTCKTLPKKPCLWFHLNRCLAPCLLRSQRIEAYDISDIQGQLATGSMVTFINSKPNKNFYRRFKIKITGKANDTAMLKEVLQRRLKHPEWGWPDLILIDGGKAQLNAAISITKIPVMALAKKRNSSPTTFHGNNQAKRTSQKVVGDKLYMKGQKNTVLLKNLPREIFNLILQLRDEAHRFAKKYHHILRVKELIKK